MGWQTHTIRCIKVHVGKLSEQLSSFLFTLPMCILHHEYMHCTPQLLHREIVSLNADNDHGHGRRQVGILCVGYEEKANYHP
jgi:hypothetical protein